jgi:hypothetical protein
MDRQLAWRLEDQEPERRASKVEPQKADDDECVMQLLDDVETLVDGERTSWASADR